MRTLLSIALSVSVVAAGVGAGLPASGPAVREADAQVRLASTVLTFEGGLIGIQPFFFFTPRQLRGDLCSSPNSCDPVYYPAIPFGQPFNDEGAARLQAAVDSRAGDPTPITLVGHSQGGQVIYTALRHWASDPSSAPDPAKVSWVSIGNPENVVGGRAPNPVPTDSAYSGIEVIRQYDGWADVPTDKTNLLAALNAAVGRSTTHVFGYFDVDLEDPANIRYTPDDAEGNPGKITYVFVPSPMLPLVEMTGLLAPMLNPILDPILRPIVESAYQRPFDVPAPVTPAASSVRVVADPVAEVEMLDDGDARQERKQHKSHHRRPSDRGRPERLGVDPVRDQVGAARRSAAGERVHRVKDLRRAHHAGD